MKRLGIKVTYFLSFCLLLSSNCHPKDKDDDCKGDQCACELINEEDEAPHSSDHPPTVSNCSDGQGGAKQAGSGGTSSGGKGGAASSAAGGKKSQGTGGKTSGDDDKGDKDGGNKGKGDKDGDDKDDEDDGPSKGKGGHQGAVGGGSQSSQGTGGASGGVAGTGGGTGGSGAAGSCAAGTSFDCSDPRISFHLEELLTSSVGVANFAQKWACKHPAKPLPSCFVAPAGHISDDDCFTKINAQTQALLQLTGGACEDLIQQQFDQAAAFCASPDVGLAQARYLGEINTDYRRLALSAYSHTISIAQYLASVRDRTRKRVLSENDPCWVLDYQHGDQDGDLVPDSRDQCPGTPDLSATDDQGCPLVGLPEAPDEATVFAALGGMGLVGNGACEKAPRPLPPAVLTFSDDELNLEDVPIFTLSPAGPQPVGCPVFYQIRVDTVTEGQSDSFMLIFRQEEGLSTAPDGLAQIVFRAHTGDPGDRGRFAALVVGTPGHEEVKIQAAIQARVVNGRGDVSGWGRTLYTSFY
jgi:hypothetical protein